MSSNGLKKLRVPATLFIVAFAVAGCTTQATSRYYGKTEAPKENVLRYITGSEPESLDPPVPNGQPEARILMALYDSLIEYDPYTMEPIPSGAVSWAISEDATEYTFNLRKGAKFSDGMPITANDYAFSFRRAFSPELASRNASLGYYILYSEAYNSGQSFVKNADGSYVSKPDIEGAVKNKAASAVSPEASSTDTSNSKSEPERLTVPSDSKARAKLLEEDPKLAAAVEGKELVPVTAEDIGVEAVDDHTLKIKLYQPAPYFLGLLGHQFFRVVPKHIVEKYGDQWARPENVVTSGAFRLQAHRPYDELIVVKDPQHWDAANVKLERIEFYPMDEQTTMLNLYQSGNVDALYNHTVPSAWFDEISKYTAEYMFEPENANEFYSISVKKPPMDIQKVRDAFALAVDRDAWTAMKKTYKPLIDIVPFGIFPAYEEAREKVYSELLAKQGSSLDEWKARNFDAEKARKLMTEAGFPVLQEGSGWACPDFPVELISVTYNTSDSNKATAEFMQAQWKQNLGITVPLKNMEFKTFQPMVNKVQYSGFARRGWSGDYMDPYTFLYLFYSAQNASATGWFDPKYDRMIDEANSITDEQKRYEKLAEAEFYVAQQQVIMPLGVPGTSWMKKPYVKGMYPNPGTLHAWKFVYIERDPAKWDQDASTILTNRDPAVDAQIKALTASQEQFMNSQKAETAATTTK